MEMTPVKKGFTLIEVMVVLSVLALLTVLGYSFFGSILKEARNKAYVTGIGNNLYALETAWLRHEQKTGNRLSSTDLSALVDAGELRAIPSLPEGAIDPTVTVPTGYICFTGNDYGGPSAANDVICYAQGVTAELCDTWNDERTSIGHSHTDTTSMAVIGALLDADNPVCWHFTSATPSHVIVSRIESN